MTRVVFALLSALASAGALRKDSIDTSLDRTGATKLTLRVCNAYPYEAQLDVYRGKSEKLTEKGPLAYRSCEDLQTKLKPGDKLEFRVGAANAGTFSVSEVPDHNNLLLLVIYRHDTVSTQVSFASHVFSRLMNAQAAVIDTYRGKETAKLSIKDAREKSHPRDEDLRYNSVVALNKGEYQVVMKTAEGPVYRNLVALNGESYVILRTGVAAQGGPSYSEDLVVFPQSDARELEKSGGASLAVTSLALAVVAKALFA